MNLDERSRQILEAVIQLYISYPGPVGSRAVTKKFPIGLSPATIRNIMSDLEDMGFLRQPHTSAGRVPTDIAYRYYVDGLTADRADLDIEFIADMNRKLDVFRRDINSFLDNASRMLSELSHYVGISVAPNANRTTFSRIEFVPYRNNQVAAILFTDEAMIRHTIISTDRELSREDLNRLSDYINDRFSGSSPDEIRRILQSEISSDHLLCDDLITRASNLCRDIFSMSDGNIFISGLSEVATLPDFGDISKIRGLLRALEDKHTILKFIDTIADTEGPQVFIGSENPFEGMKEFSLVAATYREGNRPIGAIGIIGPTRMNYSQAIAIVDTTANLITDLLSYNR